MHSKSERPWIKTKGYGIIKAVDGKKEQKTTPTAKTTIKKQTEPDRRHQMVNSKRYWQILRTLRQKKSS